jgi:rhamnulokinase
MSRFLAFDLGAESGRALVGDLSGGRLTLEAVHRFANAPRYVDATLRWDVEALWAEIRRALALSPGPLTSVGLDTWGCDYALVDAEGALVELPYHYRDHRTDGVMDRVLARLGRTRVYETTGVQFLPFNTLFQLAAAAEARPSALDRAAAFLTNPDLFNYWLTGRLTCEYTNATTTQCVDARQRTWAASLIDALDLPRHLFGPIVEPGTVLGPLQASASGPTGVPVVAPACHDTGSAVASVAAGDDTAFLSSGTWSLLGVEVAAPVITARSAALNFTNEGGVCGTTRLLKNIGGLWLLQACRRDWAADGRDLSYEHLAAAAADTSPFGPVIDPDDPSFLNPDHMPRAIADYCRRTSQPIPDHPAAVARTVFESLALKYRMVIEWLEEVSGLSIRTVRVIGGGAQNRLLNQLTADATGRDVLAGPVEATALGNIAMQMLATGHADSLAAARDIINRSFPAERFLPKDPAPWDRQYRRFRDVATRADLKVGPSIASF